MWEGPPGADFQVFLVGGVCFERMQAGQVHFEVWGVPRGVPFFQLVCMHFLVLALRPSRHFVVLVVSRALSICFANLAGLETEIKIAR